MCAQVSGRGIPDDTGVYSKPLSLTRNVKERDL